MKKELMGLIVKRDDGSEIVNYDNPSFPSYIYAGWVGPKCTWERVPHYHEDLEIVTVTEGTMAYSVNGRTVILHEGDTIVVNSNQIHYSMSVDDQLAKYVIFVVHPSILMSSVTVEMEAIRPVIDNPELPFIRFRYINNYTKDMYDLMIDLPDHRHNAFEITKRLFLMWELIMKKMEDFGPVAEDKNFDPRLMSFKTMLHFMNNNYKETITLEQIASAGNVSKSLCNNLFNQFVGESPINYLMHLRARKVAEHLRSGSYTLKQIADLTGFNGVSYMSETFKKFFGQSPRDYKKQWNSVEG